MTTDESPLASGGGANLARRLAGPAFEGVREPADLAIAEQPCDLGNGQAAFAQLTFGEVHPQVRQTAREGEAPGCQPPAGARPPIAQLVASLVFLRLPVREQQDNRILQTPPQRPARRGMLGQSL